MWSTEYRGTSSATPDEVFAVLADVAGWSEWNDGVEASVLHGPFRAGTAGEMTLPGGPTLPFRVVTADAPSEYTDVTDIPDAGVTVTVRHLLQPSSSGGTDIVYRVEVDGRDASTEEQAGVGEAVSEDFSVVIAALAARAQARPASTA